MEWRSGGEMSATFKNKNRGYQQLRVCDDAIEFYGNCSRVFRAFPYDLKRVASQAIASADSVHRNIAEGYCRRSLREYLNFLIDHLVIQESNVTYNAPPHPPIPPILPNTP